MVWTKQGYPDLQVDEIKMGGRKNYPVAGIFSGGGSRWYWERMRDEREWCVRVCVLNESFNKKIIIYIFFFGKGYKWKMGVVSCLVCLILV